MITETKIIFMTLFYSFLKNSLEFANQQGLYACMNVIHYFWNMLKRVYWPSIKRGLDISNLYILLF